jgi:hypothetical protein
MKVEIDKFVWFCIVNMFSQGDEYRFTLPAYLSVQRLATGWTVRGSSPLQARFSASFQTSLEPIQLSV